MGELGFAQKRARLLDGGDHRLVGVALLAVGLVDAQAGEERHRRVIGPVPRHRLRHLDAVAGAQIEIVLAVAGRHVDESGAVFLGDEIAGQ